MIDPRLDDALVAATEKARLFTTDTLVGEYVDGWRDAVKALAEILPMLVLREALEGCCFTCGADAVHAHSPTCTANNMDKAIRRFCNAMVRG